MELPSISLVLKTSDGVLKYKIFCLRLKYIKTKKNRVTKIIEMRNKSLVLIFFVSIQDALA
jgi:hypothetical protein|tara:strand:+ start:3565 stop:3747 length:183 start_codon:yes stop_codon:yes gene_type:complete